MTGGSKISSVRIRLFVLALVLLPGCTTHPITGRDQMVAMPGVQIAFADADYSLSTGAQRITASRGCVEGCASSARLARFTERIAYVGARLENAARGMSPELFERIGGFSISVDGHLGVSTASSAGGRIVIGAGVIDLESRLAPTGLESGLGGLEPQDTLIAFLLAREMAHVIARHAEENSGASMAVSAIGLLVPGVNVFARFLVARISAGALRESWSTEQAREADEIALALLQSSGLSLLSVSLDLGRGIDHARLPADAWGEAYLNSAQRVAYLAATPMRYTRIGP